MTRYAALAVWLTCVTAASAAAEAPEEAPLIPPDAVVEVVSTGDYRFTEGPALAPDGSIYFSDIPNNSIHRYDPDTGETTLFTDDSGGANGLMIVQLSEDEARLFACEGRRRAVATYRLSDPESREVFVDRYDGKRLNSPNDLTMMYPIVLFTDPRYGKQDDRELEAEHVFILPPSPRGEQRIIPLAADFQKPNGIVHCPSSWRLFIADNKAKTVAVVPFGYRPDPVMEELPAPEVFANLADLGGPDGMTVDHAGRLYVAIFGQGILILSPDGDRLGFIETGPQTTNCVFGADGQTLYVTAEKSLKRVVLNTGAPAVDD
ncbi:MAG: SMP-30/gluconolactonase/LRE family protein [Planctomycetota bacterium]